MHGVYTKGTVIVGEIYKFYVIFRNEAKSKEAKEAIWDYVSVRT